MKPMEMKAFVAALEEYIACETPKSRIDGAETLLEMLYDVYTEFDGIENDTIRKGFDELYTAMNGKTLQEMDEILDPVCTLCREHQKAGFEEGVRVGIRLAKELAIV